MFNIQHYIIFVKLFLYKFEKRMYNNRVFKINHTKSIKYKDEANGKNYCFGFWRTV